MVKGNRKCHHHLITYSNSSKTAISFAFFSQTQRRSSNYSVHFEIFLPESVKPGIKRHFFYFFIIQTKMKAFCERKGSKCCY